MLAPTARGTAEERNRAQRHITAAVPRIGSASLQVAPLYWPSILRV
jgi:hypothetical protein